MPTPHTIFVRLKTGNRNSAIPGTECFDLFLTRNCSTEWREDDVGVVQATAELLEVVACCRVVFKFLVCPARRQNVINWQTCLLQHWTQFSMSKTVTCLYCTRHRQLWKMLLENLIPQTNAWFKHIITNNLRNVTRKSLNFAHIKDAWHTTTGNAELFNEQYRPHYKMKLYKSKQFYNHSQKNSMHFRLMQLL